MLLELSIRDLALFEEARVVFGAGFGVVTGETGAGKSLLVGALELLLGQRPRGAAQVVRQGAREARVSGRFVLAPEVLRASGLLETLAAELPELAERWREEEAAAPHEERELLLERAIDAEGRSRAFVDGRPATLRALKALAAELVEIHGQNDHQRLFEPAEQLRLVDEYGEHAELLAGWRSARAAWLEARARRIAWDEQSAERAERLDLLRLRASELERLRLEPGELLALRSERELLRHAGAIASELGAVAAELAEDEGALARLRRAEATLERWRERVELLEPAAEALAQARIALEEGGRELERFLADVDASPGRLEEVEGRLYALEELARRLRIRPEELSARAGELGEEIAGLEQDERARAVLEAELERTRLAALEHARALSRARRALVPQIEQAVKASLAALGLAKARFAIALDTQPAERGEAPGPGGLERVEMQLAANPGEAFQPLRAVASGGEAARILLALRTALAVRRTIPTLVFDEVDANVGGRLGPKVGEHLAALAAHHQVLCVTHLPAIAARAERHHKVAKHSAKGRTRTRVEELSGEARVAEIADMIAGGGAEETARAEAERLLRR